MTSSRTIPTIGTGGGGGGAYGLGPAPNTFADATARDAQATADAAWLTQYNDNRFFWIRNGTNIQRRNAAGNGWENVTLVVQGRRGSAGPGATRPEVYAFIKVILQAGSNIALTPDDVAGTITISASGEAGNTQAGTTVIANPSGTGGRALTRITIGDTTYVISAGGSGNVPSAGAQDVGRILRVGSDEMPFWDEVIDILDGHIPSTYGLTKEDVSLVKHLPVTHEYVNSTTIDVYFVTAHTYSGLDSLAKYQALAWSNVSTQNNLRTGGRLLVRVPISSLSLESYTRGRYINVITDDSNANRLDVDKLTYQEQYRDSIYVYLSSGEFAIHVRTDNSGYNHQFRFQDYSIEASIGATQLATAILNRLLPAPTVANRNKIIAINAAGSAWEMVDGPIFYPPAIVAVGAGRLALRNGETSLDVALGAVTSASGFLSVSGNEFILRRGVYRFTSAFVHYSAASGAGEYNNNTQTRFDVMMEASGTGIVQAEEGGYTRPIGGQSYGHHSVGVTVYVPADATAVELGLVGHAQSNSGFIGLSSIFVWPISVA